MSILSNFPLLAAVSAIIAAQFVKVPVYLVMNRTWKLGLAFSTGGMPSSHAAAVASLATAVGLLNGFGSSVFAIAAIFSVITMYDAAGIRRHAGIHASVLNRWTRLIPSLQSQGEGRAELKEMLGHRPSEVCAGAVFGIVISLLLQGAFPNA